MVVAGPGADWAANQRFLRRTAKPLAHCSYVISLCVSWLSCNQLVRAPRFGALITNGFVFEGWPPKNSKSLVGFVRFWSITQGVACHTVCGSMDAVCRCVCVSWAATGRLVGRAS